MGYFKNLGSAIVGSNTAMAHPTNSGWLNGIFSALRGTRFNYVQRVGDGHDASVVMAPVTWIMQNAAQVPWDLQQLIKDQWEAQPDHDIIDLIDTPNQEYSGDQLVMGTIVCLLTSVDAYWIIIRDNANKASELWLAPSHLVTPMTRPGNEVSSFIDFYDYRPGGQTREILPEDMIHFRIGIDPNDVRHGLSPLYPILREVFTDVEAANFTGALLHNMGIPGVIISPKGEVKITNTDDVKKKFGEEFGGDKRGGSMVNSVPVDVQTFGFNPDDMAIEKLRNISEERVCANLHVKPSTIGFGTGLQQTKVGATAQEERKSSWEDGVIPLIKMMTKTVTRKLVPEFGGQPRNMRLWPDLSDVEALKESADALVKRVILKVKGGIMTVMNAQRELGDEVDDTQNVYLRSGNTLEIPTGAKGIGVTLDEVVAATKMLLKGTKAKPTQDQAKLMAQFNRDTRALEPPFQQSVDNFLTEWAGIIADAAVPILENKQLAETQLILDEIDLIKMENDLKKLFGFQYERTAEATINALQSTMGVTIGRPDLVAQAIVAIGGRQAGLVDMTGSVRRKLFEILADAEAAGFGVPETTRLIRDTVTAGRFSNTTIRARLIARTETLHAQRESALLSYHQIPDVNSVLVFDARLGETDEVCANLDGTTVTLAEAEILSVEEHPNGTRSFAPIVT